ncbi:GTP cyclohydrolase 1 feedback regulatory protein isoform X1 [Rhea pennata]|uniref:GTP cyclohydrolase 1 feedback regulatory protein isoform X1 n=1 Tax=Rhea pennata TaxID=8795 RepID=UPI002E260A36
MCLSPSCSPMQPALAFMAHIQRFWNYSPHFKEVGPTMVGDEHSDPNLMNYLGATKRNMLGNHFWEYYVNDAPRIVLDKLESCGYRVVSMTGVGQTLVWCLHKE